MTGLVWTLFPRCFVTVDSDTVSWIRGMSIVDTFKSAGILAVSDVSEGVMSCFAAYLWEDSEPLLFFAMRTLAVKAIVLVPYKFTLLSNCYLVVQLIIAVLVPYKFTLLSNRWAGRAGKKSVLVPYKFTLLSNGRGRLKWLMRVLVPYKFTLLSNYFSIASSTVIVLVPYKFTLLSNLKPQILIKIKHIRHYEAAEVRQMGNKTSSILIIS